MVAEEAPCVLCPDRRRVGVKRSREQTDRLAAATAEVRPALDADRARPVITPTMNTEGAGVTSTSTDPWPPRRLPTSPRPLLSAAVLSAVADDSDRTDLFDTDTAVTHGLLGVAEAHLALDARVGQTGRGRASLGVAGREGEHALDAGA